MNPTGGMDANLVAKLLSSVNEMIKENPFKRQPRRLGHEATPLKKIRGRQFRQTNEQKKLAERKEKKHRRMEFQSRKINRSRGVG